MLLLLFFGSHRRRFPMPAVSLTVDRIDYPPGGAIVAYFSDSSSQSFANVAAVEAFANILEVVPDLLPRSAMAHFLARSPNAADDTQIEGKTFSFDPLQNGSVIGVN